jgi:hypothetical protein
MFHVKQAHLLTLKWMDQLVGKRFFIPIYTEIFKKYTEVIPKLYTEPWSVMFHVKHYGNAWILYDNYPKKTLNMEIKNKLAGWSVEHKGSTAVFRMNSPK